jgi:hypothetical protein
MAADALTDVGGQYQWRDLNNPVTSIRAATQYHNLINTRTENSNNINTICRDTMEAQTLR